MPQKSPTPQPKEHKSLIVYKTPYLHNLDVGGFLFAHNILYLKTINFSQKFYLTIWHIYSLITCVWKIELYVVWYVGMLVGGQILPQNFKGTFQGLYPLFTPTNAI